MDNLLKLEHENDVLQKRIEELEAEIEVWKRTATEYAGIVKDMRKEKSELLKF